MHVADTAVLLITTGLLAMVGLLLIATARRQVDVIAKRRADAAQPPPSPALVWAYRIIGGVALIIGASMVVRLLL